LLLLQLSILKTTTESEKNKLLKKINTLIKLAQLFNK